MSNSHTLLIVDDEPNIRRILQAAFEKQGYNVLTACGGREALETLQQEHVDAMVSDVIMPDMHGTEALKLAREAYPDLVVVLMTAFGTIPQAVEAMRLGAFDYVSKPFDLEVLKKVVARGLAIRSEVKSNGKASARRLQKSGATKIIGSGVRMTEVNALINQIADAKATVLITGESGTGKELVAKSLHDRSCRANKPFIAISCAALPETLLESELFGHEKGAFTGANGTKPGRFELANGGTQFLDEIGDIPMPTQIKLLRALQEREFERLGGTKTIKTDVRLVTATNRDLQEAVKAGIFRADLYYRLQVVQVSLPALRERTEDIPALCAHFLEKYNLENGRSITKIDEAAMNILMTYQWPGNIRELENMIERAVVLAPSDASVLTVELLPPALSM